MELRIFFLLQEGNTQPATGPGFGGGGGGCGIELVHIPSRILQPPT